MTVDLTYTDSDLQFPKDVEADFGAGIVVSKSRRIALRMVRAWINIDANADAGDRNVAITDKDGAIIGTKVAGFEVTA